MTVTQQLDGQELWTLRAGCMLGSSRLEEAYRCNKQHHPDWPSASGRYDGPSPLPRDDELPRPTSLCEAAGRGDLAGVEAFLADPSQRQARCPDGLGVGAKLDALMAASVSGKLSLCSLGQALRELHVVRLLVENGFDPLEADDTGRSAYVWAASGNHIDVVDYFWARGARPAAQDPFIGAVLWSAALWGRLAILEHYATRSADLNAGHHGYSPVMAAAQSGHLEVVRWLLSHGASPEGAVEVARRFHRDDVVSDLESPAPGSGVAP